MFCNSNYIVIQYKGFARLNQLAAPFFDIICKVYFTFFSLVTAEV